MLEKKYDFIDNVTLESGLKLLLVTIVTFVAEIEEYYSATKDMENEIKNRIKLMQKQLYIAQTMIDDEIIHKQNKLNTENVNIEKFNYLDEKSVADGLRYIITSIVKIQISVDLDTITAATTIRVKQRLKAVNRHFREIDKLYYSE